MDTIISKLDGRLFDSNMSSYSEFEGGSKKKNPKTSVFDRIMV